MKTKGIVTSDQIAEYTKSHGGHSKLSNSVSDELFLKSMLISCFAYGGLDKESYNFKRYVKPYQDKMSKKLFESIYNEMNDHFKGCDVVYAGTDHEGCSYNSIVEKQ